MPKYYAISAVISTSTASGVLSATQVPHFLLRTSTQGIVDAGHAERIAADVIDPKRHMRDAGATIHVTAIGTDS